MTSNQNPELQLAANYINHTDRNIFLTGKAGTGKTTFLRNLHTLTHKRMVVVAPTGVAAINAEGVTIHSFFQIGFGVQIPTHYLNDGGEKAKIDFSKYRKERKDIIKSLDLLVIDEISMVRADLLDAIDLVLRQFRKRHLPFGGVQLLMIGDMSQLEPIARDDEWSILKNYYQTKFFFSSLALQQSSFISIELQKIYRQVDQTFINILNKVRNNDIDTDTLHQLNRRYQPNFEPPKGENYIILTTHNAYAINYNNTKIKALDGSKHLFTAKVTGDFPESSYPTDFELEIKIGSQVMFNKNDSSPDKLYFNGKIGEVKDIDEGKIIVKCKNDPYAIEVKVEKWENKKYTLNADTKEIEEDLVGTFTQIPLKLAWAITIHKSQGLTFEKAIIDASQSFTFGQVYVALSRCKSLEGMVLSAPINTGNIMSSAIITDFSKFVETNQPTQEHLDADRIHYQEKLVFELFNFNTIKQLVTKVTNTILGHQSAVPKIYSDKFLQIETDVNTQIIDVADKFTKQISALCSATIAATDNSQLQERVTKSVPYFTQKLTDIVISPLAKFTIEIDNKAIKEQIEKDLKLLYLESNIKEKCLQSAKKGFSINEYLQARATSSINEKLEKADEKKSAKNYKESATEFSETFVPPNPKLYYSLRRFAKETAQKMNAEPHIVLPYKTIIEICTRLPKTVKELEKVKGIGKAKIDTFGKEILQQVASYVEENKEVVVEPEPETEQETKAKKLSASDSAKASLQLFTNGMPIKEIAKVRGFVNSTIFGHLLTFVQSGELEPNKLIEQDKLNEIIILINDNKGKTTAEIRELTNNKFSYDEFRIAKFHLQKEEI